MLAIVVSRADSASVHIGDQLLELEAWEERTDETRPDADGGATYHRLPDAELRTFDDLHLHLDGVADAFDDPHLLVFASRHAGDTGPLLTAHATGNFGPAEYGGEPNQLAQAAPNALARVVEAFDEYAPEGYDVGVECTHHGPSEVGCPSLFVELGSDEAQWADPEGAQAVARAIFDLRGVPADRERTLVGGGGGHYAPRFERVVRETDWAVGHVAADWGLDAMGDPRENRHVVEEAFERSGATRAVVEGSHPTLCETIEGLGYEVVSETWARETTGIPLELVNALEEALCSVENGLRFGTPARKGETGDVDPLDLPGELLTEANGIDRGRIRETVQEHALAYVTEEGATKVAGPVALAHSETYDAIVEAFCEVLREKYDEVRREGDEILARVESFDPALAREVGVPEGPAFGRLAAGERVEVEEREVAPEQVHRAREMRFHV